MNALPKEKNLPSFMNSRLNEIKFKIKSLTNNLNEDQPIGNNPAISKMQESYIKE